MLSNGKAAAIEKQETDSVDRGCVQAAARRADSGAAVQWQFSVASLLHAFNIYLFSNNMRFWPRVESRMVFTLGHHTLWLIDYLGFGLVAPHTHTHTFNAQHRIYDFV